ncbi:hypothetical protein [Methanomethylovorans sp.]|uniref:hypothetical protein n=1 Tax=Methanomethylovorans sp. TaxID=2758717 RepID=UPI00351C9BEC
MKKILFILLILSFITMSTASAELFNDLDRAVTEYNAYYEQLPSPIKILLGNERILANITLNDGSELNVYFVTENGRVDEFEKVEQVEDYEPTVIITADEDTVISLITTTDPLSVYEEARESGTLVIDPIGLVSSAKFLVYDNVLEPGWNIIKRF